MMALFHQPYHKNEQGAPVHDVVKIRCADAIGQAGHIAFKIGTGQHAGLAIKFGHPFDGMLVGQLEIFVYDTGAGGVGAKGCGVFKVPEIKDFR